MSTQIEEVKATPGLPPTTLEAVETNGSTFDPSQEVFVFTYKKGHTLINQHVQGKSLGEVVKDAKEVCRLHRWTFIQVTPFLRDLQKMKKLDD